MPVFRLSDDIEFPPAQFARDDGLLAVGGDLSEERILLAYRMGIFPWFSEDAPFLWWSPDPRLVLFPNEINISRSLKKLIRKNKFEVTLDTAFREVITSCAEIRLDNGDETWICNEMVDAYCRLHASGYAHSVEAWHNGRLVGGLYGVSLGRCFFGESMFAYEPNASKVAFAKLVTYLAEQDYDLIDCQVTTDHLLRFGAREISKAEFLMLLENSLKKPTRKGEWDFSDTRNHSY